jgi:hypothetical protein
MRKIWLTPAFTLAAFFGSAAQAQVTPAPSTIVSQEPLPDAPSAKTQTSPIQISPQWQVKPDYKLDLSTKFEKPAEDGLATYRLPAMPPEFADKPSGFVGRAVEFFDQHSVKGDSMFDTALEKDIGGGFSIAGGSIDMRNNTGHNGAIRQTVRAMTGLPDSETRDLRHALSGGGNMPQPKGGDGVAVALRFRIGLK